MNKLESLQYQAGLAVTGMWQGTSRDRVYEELGWESLHLRRWFRRLTVFYKIINNLTPQYLREPVPSPRNHLYGTSNTNDLYPIRCRTQRFQNSFFPDAVKSWNNIGPDIRKLDSLSSFKSTLTQIIKLKKSLQIISLLTILNCLVCEKAISCPTKVHYFLNELEILA